MRCMLASSSAFVYRRCRLIPTTQCSRSISMKRSCTQTLAFALVLAQSFVAATASASDPAQNAQQPGATAAHAPDPLGDLDSSFLEAYTSLMASVTKAGQPYIVVAGSNLVLHRKGQQESVRVLPDIYHALKDVAH